MSDVIYTYLNLTCKYFGVLYLAYNMNSLHELCLLLKLNLVLKSSVAETESRVSPHQDGDDAFELLLHQVTDDLVVEVLHRLPLKRQTFLVRDQEKINSKLSSSTGRGQHC